ncbi:hypothetical protein VE03_01977 [Pseudogymnoascus sp. 23342-1-I1]|nr:hypothetical protein VE03_01977 [Pseudogymnoascus sp. 23342-1-I1]
MDSPLSPTPVEGEQQPPDSSDSSESPGLWIGQRRNLLPARRLIDFEPLRQPSITYQHGRDSPVLGQPLEPPDAPELPQPSFQSEDPFLPTRRPVEFVPFRLPDSPLPDGQSSPFWGQYYLSDTSDSSSEFYPPEYDIVYSNGWINEIPIRPMDYEFRMLPIPTSQYGRDSTASGGSEPPDPFQDFRKFKRGRTHGRSTSIERACKAWAHELANSTPNSNQIDADSEDLFASLENLALHLVDNQPSMEAPPQPSVKQPPDKYKISKSTRVLPPQKKTDVEDLPFWIKYKLHLGIRLPPGMVNLAQLDLPIYLVRKLKDPLRYFPKSLLFNENSPFGTVIPKKGQIGIHPTFRTLAPEDILKAEKELQLEKERRFLTPEEAWRSPIIEDHSSDAGTGSLMAHTPTTVDNRTSPTNKFQDFEQWKSEDHNRTVYEGSDKPVSSDQLEAFPAFDEAFRLSDHGMEPPIEDQASVRLDQSMESPDMGLVALFSGQDKESDQGSTYLGQGIQCLDVEAPIKDEASICLNQSMESSDIGSVTMFSGQDEESDQRSIYLGQGAQYIDVESPIEDQASVCLDQSMESPDMGLVALFSGQDKESEQGSTYLDQGIQYLDVESPIEGQIAVALAQGTSQIENQDPPIENQDLAIEKEDWEIASEGSGYYGQGMEYLLDDVASRYFHHAKKSRVKSRVKDRVSVYSDHGMEYLDIGPPSMFFNQDIAHRPPSMFFDQDIEHHMEDQDSMPSSASVQYSQHVHEDIPIVRWFFEPIDDGSAPLIQPSSRQYKKTEKIYKRNSADFAHLPPVDFTKSYEHFATTQFGKLMTSGGLEDYNTSGEEKVEKATEVTEHPRMPTQIYCPRDHEMRMQELFAEIELEGATRILTMWQEVYAERAEEERAEEGGTGEELVTEEQPEIALEDSKIMMTPELDVPLGRKHSKRKSWFGGLTAEREDRQERRKSQGAELSMNNKRMSWLGVLDSAREEQTHESSRESIGYVTQEPADLLVRKDSKRRTWFGGLPAKRHKQTEEAFGDSQETMGSGLSHPLERTRSKRMSWFGMHPAEKDEPTKEDLDDNHGKSIQAPVNPLERKALKRRSWLLGHSTEKMGQANDNPEDNPRKLIQETVNPLERKGSKRRSWFPGHSAETVERIPEDSHGKLTPRHVHSLERKASKRRSWFGHSSEREAQSREDLEDSQGKLTQESIHPLDRKGSKRRSWFPGHPAETEIQTPEDSHEKLIPVHIHPLERKISKRKTWFGGHPVKMEVQSKEDLEDSQGKSTQASIHPLERKASKRRSWYPGHLVKTEGRSSEDSHEKLIPGHVYPLERKDSKRKSWFGGLHPETEERARYSFEKSHGKVTPEPAQPLEQKQSKRKSWFGVVPAKRDEQTHETFELSNVATGGQGQEDPSEQVRANQANRAKRVSWFGGLSTQKEKQTKNKTEDSHGNVTQGPADPTERKRAKRASWFGVLPSDREKTERKPPWRDEEERKRKRSSWIV